MSFSVHTFYCLKSTKDYQKICINHNRIIPHWRNGNSSSLKATKFVKAISADDIQKCKMKIAGKVESRLSGRWSSEMSVNRKCFRQQCAFKMPATLTSHKQSDSKLKTRAASRRTCGAAVRLIHCSTSTCTPNPMLYRWNQCCFNCPCCLLCYATSSNVHET